MAAHSDRDGLQRRIARLSPQRRELLGMLVGGGGASAGPSHPAPPRGSLSITREAVSADEGKERGRKLYELVNQNLDRTPFAAHTVFMNLGYVADESPRLSPIRLPRRCLNRNALQLALEVIADVPLGGRTVVDVGCGRGGTIAAIRAYYSPRLVVGVDFSRSAIAFCRRRHRFERTFFVEGNAHELPLADATCCVLTNIESASSYADVGRFYGEVLRVLRPGGYFLYADVVARGELAARRRTLAAVGFAVESERDITPNVIASCDETAKVHRMAIGEGHEDEVLANFLALPDSAVNRQMRRGELAYVIYKARKA